MDPIAYVFSAYLNSVQTATYDHLTDSIGTEIRAVVIEYEGVSVPFQFQMWRIKNRSVCRNLDQNIAAYSKCTIKASKLFNQLCSELPTKRSKDWRYIKKLKTCTVMRQFHLSQQLLILAQQAMSQRYY